MLMGANFSILPLKSIQFSVSLKTCIYCTQVPETSFDLLLLEQITQLLYILELQKQIPETYAVYAGL